MVGTGMDEESTKWTALEEKWRKGKDMKTKVRERLSVGCWKSAGVYFDVGIDRRCTGRADTAITLSLKTLGPNALALCGFVCGCLRTSGDLYNKDLMLI